MKGGGIRILVARGGTLIRVHRKQIRGDRLMKNIVSVEVEIGLLLDFIAGWLHIRIGFLHTKLIIHVLASVARAAVRSRSAAV